MANKKGKRGGKQSAYSNGNRPSLAGHLPSSGSDSSSSLATPHPSTIAQPSSLFGDPRRARALTALPEQHFPPLGAKIASLSSTGAAEVWIPIQPSAAEQWQWEGLERDRESARLSNEAELLWNDWNTGNEGSSSPTAEEQATLATFVFNPKRKFGKDRRQQRSVLFRMPVELLSKVINNLDRQSLWRLAMTCQKGAVVVSSYATVWDLSTGDMCGAEKGPQGNGRPTDVTVVWRDKWVDSTLEKEIQILKNLTLSFSFWAPDFRSLEFQRLPRLTTDLLYVVLPKLDNLTYLGIFECALIGIIDLIDDRRPSLISLVKKGTRLDLFPTVQHQMGKPCWFVDRSSDCFLGLGPTLLKILPLARQRNVSLIEPGSAFRRWLNLVERRIPNHQLAKIERNQQDDELVKIFFGGRVPNGHKAVNYYECRQCDLNLRGVFYAPNQIKDPTDAICWGCRTTENAQDKRGRGGEIGIEWHKATEWMAKKTTWEELVAVAKTKIKKKPGPGTDAWGKLAKESANGKWGSKGSSWKDNSNSYRGRRYHLREPPTEEDTFASETAPQAIIHAPLVAPSPTIPSAPAATPAQAVAVPVFSQPILLVPPLPIVQALPIVPALPITPALPIVPACPIFPTLPIVPSVPVIPAVPALRGGHGRNSPGHANGSRANHSRSGQVAGPTNTPANSTRGNHGGNRNRAGQRRSNGNGNQGENHRRGSQNGASQGPVSINERHNQQAVAVSVALPLCPATNGSGGAQGARAAQNRTIQRNTASNGAQCNNRGNRVQSGVANWANIAATSQAAPPFVPAVPRPTSARPPIPAVPRAAVPVVYRPVPTVGASRAAGQDWQ